MPGKEGLEDGGVGKKGHGSVQKVHNTMALSHGKER